MSARPGRSEWDSSGSDSDTPEPVFAASVVNTVAVDARAMCFKVRPVDDLEEAALAFKYEALRMKKAARSMELTHVPRQLPHVPRQWEYPFQYALRTGTLSITDFLQQRGWQEELDAARERALPAQFFHDSLLLYVAKEVLDPNLIIAPFPPAASPSFGQPSNASTADSDDEPLARRVRRKFPELELPRLVTFRMMPTAEIQPGMSADFLLPATRWLRKSDADRAALAYHGSAEAMEQARKKKQKEDAVIAVRAARSKTLMAALTAADADPSCLPQKSYRQKAAVRAVTAYMSGIPDISKKAMHDVVVRCAGAKFLHLHTSFLADCKTFGVESMNSDKHAKLMKLALEPYGGSWPAVWPWLTWTQDTHLLVSSQPFKDAVRAWLMVANRLKVPQLVAVEVVRVMLLDKNQYCRQKPRWWPLRLMTANSAKAAA